MGIIVDINKNQENVVYSSIESENDEISTKCNNLTIINADDRFHVFVGDSENSFSRKELAEFLWSAAMLLDGDQEWFGGDYPCLDKDNEQEERSMIDKKHKYLLPKKILIPSELTAENGAKYLLIGEFNESIEMPCPECEGYDGDCDDCDICGGDKVYQQKILVSWSTIKEIYKKCVDNLAIKLEKQEEIK